MLKLAAQQDYNKHDTDHVQLERDGAETCGVCVSVYVCASVYVCVCVFVWGKNKAMHACRAVFASKLRPVTSPAFQIRNTKHKEKKQASKRAILCV